MEHSVRISVRKSELVPYILTEAEKQKQLTAYETGATVPLGFKLKQGGRLIQIYVIAFCNGTSVFIRRGSQKVFVDIDENR